VVYHTLTEKSFYGNKFLPTLGAVTCYDENDTEIVPTEIYFCPQIIKDGMMEASKIIIKWVYPQTGKCFFDPGFSADESHDQSRFLYNMSKGEFDGTNECAINWNTTLKATGTVTTEPYQTLKPFSNGKIIQYALISYGTLSELEKNSVIRIKADIGFFRDLDNALTSITTNPDILNTVTISSDDLAELVYVPAPPGDRYAFFTLYQNDIFRQSFSTSYVMNLSDIPITAINYSNLNVNAYGDSFGSPLWADNIGYYYDPDSDKPYNFNFYFHAHVEPDGAVSFTPAGTESWGNLITNIVAGEPIRPLFKIAGMNGYVKLIKKRRGFTRVQTIEGLYEAEYIIEFPCVKGSFDRRGDEFISLSQFQSRTATDREKTDPLYDERKYYRLTQLFEQNSYIQAGSMVGQPNDREAPCVPRAFGKTFAFMNGFEFEAYKKTSGGGAYLSGRKTDVITYPKNHVYKLVAPELVSQEGPITFDTVKSVYPYKIQVLSGYDPIALGAVPVNFDMQFLVLADNRKWIYGGNKVESYSGRENPSYIFEIDSSSLVLDYRTRMKDIYALPDLKRWFISYCRGFAGVMDLNYNKVSPKNSGSELVLDIWDNSAPTETTALINPGNWRSITPSQYDDQVYMDSNNQYENPDSVQATGLYGATLDTVVLSASMTIDVGSFIGFYDSGTMDRPTKYYKIIAAVIDLLYPANSIYQLSEDITYSLAAPADIQVFYPNLYVNDYRIFRFGGEKVIDGNTKLFNLLDVRNSTTRARYIDSGGKIYLRARLAKKRTYPVKKSVTDYDLFYNGDPFGTGTATQIFDWRRILLSEEISRFGLDFFKSLSL
jgi:hypothetical protein